MEIKKSIKQEENRQNKFIVLYDWLTILPPNESAMLAYLIDAEDICYCRDKEDLDYFECTAGFIVSRCVGWSSSNITTALNNLQSKNLIFIKNVRTNVGNTRFIKISRQGISSLKEAYKNKKDQLKQEKVEKSKFVGMSEN